MKITILIEVNNIRRLNEVIYCDPTRTQLDNFCNKVLEDTRLVKTITRNTCDECGGTGRIHSHNDICDMCAGRGWL